MPLERVLRSNPLSKLEFHERLIDWLSNTQESIIGSTEVDGRTKWVFVNNDESLFALNADTRREAVLDYLKLVCQYGESIQWTISSSRSGKMTAVVFGPNEERYQAFYLYVVA